MNQSIPRLSFEADRPSISVVSVVFDDSAGLKRTLLSLTSAPSSVEIVVVEGCTDNEENTRSQLHELMGESRAVFVCGHDDGPYDAMNRGVIASSGSWIWFVNAGDEVHPDVDFDDLLSTLRDSDASWVVAEVELHDGPEVTLNPTASPVEILSGRASQCHQGVLVHRRAMLTGIFDTRYKIAADYELMVRLALATPPLTLDKAVAVFYRGGLSTHRRRRLHVENFLVRFRARTQSPSWYFVDLGRTVVRLLRPSR